MKITHPTHPVIGIVGGLGQLGTVFRREFEARGHTVLISDRVKKAGVITTKELIQKADVVIVAVPLGISCRVIAEVAPLLRPEQLFLDVTSVKEKPVEEMLKSKAEVVGLHPMFGPVASVTGLNVYACPARAPTWWPWLRTTFRTMGMHVLRTTPAAHDRLMTAHQSIHHLLMIALGAFLAKRDIDVEKLFETTTPSMRLAMLTTGRLLAANPEMYRDIEFLNPHVPAVLDDLQHVVDELAVIIERRDAAAFLALFKKASDHFGDFKQFAFRETSRMFASPAATAATAAPIAHLTPTRAVKKKKTNVATLTIAILGPATQTELAAEQFIKTTKVNAEPAYFATIAETIDAVAKRHATLAVVPLENYQIGPVRETVKHLFAAGGHLRIVAEIDLAIAHALIGHAGVDTKNVKRIFAHHQARAQCQHFLAKHFPKVEIVETPHAGDAISRAAADPATVAIGPREAARTYGLAVITPHIEDDATNRTRFVVIGRAEKKNVSSPLVSRPSSLKTALTFHFTVDRAGLLAEALAIFARERINLTRIESIPTGDRDGAYFFFTECAADECDPRFIAARRDLERIARVVSFGSFGQS